MRFDGEVYRYAAEERLKEALDLQDLGHYVMSHFLSGLAVECIFRAYRFRVTPNPTDFDEKHDLNNLYRRSGFQDLIPHRRREEFEGGLAYVAKVWRNEHRFASAASLRAHLSRIKLFLKIKHGDILKENGRRMIDFATLLVARGRETW